MVLSFGVVELGDDDLGDLCRRGALGDEERQVAQRRLCIASVDRPPDRVAAERAGRDGGQVPHAAAAPLERGVRDAAFLRLVLMVDEEARHAASLNPPHPHDIGHDPVPDPLKRYVTGSRV
jgi:hypothetical protein